MQHNVTIRDWTKQGGCERVQHRTREMAMYQVTAVDQDFETVQECFDSFAEAMAEFAEVQADEWFLSAQVSHTGTVFAEWNRATGECKVW